MMKVTYLSHSGFLVECSGTSPEVCPVGQADTEVWDKIYLLFDFYKGSLPQMDKDAKLLAFVSHAHYDHFRKDLFDLLRPRGQVTFIVSDDVALEPAEDIIFMGPGEEISISGCSIRTLRSTDEGVAFLVMCAGHRIYHAGDLNWWHWEEEGQAYNTKMRRSYQQEINKLSGMEIDAAFIPVDPRLGDAYVKGLDCFMRRTNTKAVFPMHFWGNYGIFDRLELEECTREYRDRICPIHREGQEFILEKKTEKTFQEYIREGGWSE